MTSQSFAIAVSARSWKLSVIKIDYVSDFFQFPQKLLFLKIPTGENSLNNYHTCSRNIIYLRSPLATASERTEGIVTLYLLSFISFIPSFFFLVYSLYQQKPLVMGEGKGSNTAQKPVRKPAEKHGYEFCGPYVLQYYRPFGISLDINCFLFGWLQAWCNSFSIRFTRPYLHLPISLQRYLGMSCAIASKPVKIFSRNSQN